MPITTQSQCASWYVNPAARSWHCAPAPADVLGFHELLPQSAPTSLLDLPEIADELWVRRIFVKDESARLGLPAFKALGVSYAIYRVISARAGQPITPPTIAALRAFLVSSTPLELVTATDGNHGHALARMARLLGLPAHVFIPDVVDESAVRAIEQEGASVVDTDYDAAVWRAADAAAENPFAELVQDTAWPGYEQIPQLIVDGYSTLFAEIDIQMAIAGETGPSALIVPIGVGSLAQAAVTHYRSVTRRTGPTALIGVEPHAAACVQHSLSRAQILTVATGSTIMAGLNCGTPSTLAWPYLRDGLDAAITVTDEQSRVAVTDLGRAGVSSGPCGAAALAAARTIFLGEARAVTTDLGLDSSSTLILLSTEGRRPAAPGAQP